MKAVSNDKGAAESGSPGLQLPWSARQGDQGGGVSVRPIFVA
jgi:hypothetical protein